MWLRVGRRNRWRHGDADDPDAVEEAAFDLKPRENEQLSVYQVANRRQARRVAAAFAVTQRHAPDSIDIVLLPNRILRASDVTPVHRPSSQLPDYLRSRHYELPGLDSEEKQKNVAQRALRRGSGLVVERILKPEVKKFVNDRGVLRETGVLENVQPKWLQYIKKAR